MRVMLRAPSLPRGHWPSKWLADTPLSKLKNVRSYSHLNEWKNHDSDRDEPDSNDEEERLHGAEDVSILFRNCYQDAPGRKKHS